jgi:hypothetical protein
MSKVFEENLTKGWNIKNETIETTDLRVPYVKRKQGLESFHVYKIPYSRRIADRAFNIR